VDDLTLPRPYNWREGSRRVWIFSMSCVFGLTMTLGVALASPVAALILLLVLAAVVLAVLQFAEARAVVVRTRTLDVDGEDIAATVFPFRRMGVRFGWLVVGAFGVAGVVLLVRGDVLVGVVAAVLAVLGAGCWLAIHLDRRGNPPCVALCERGVVLVRGRTDLIAWDDFMVGADRARPLVNVVGGNYGRDAIVVWTAGMAEPDSRGLWRQVLDEAGGTDPCVYTHRLRCDPVVVYHALRFYQGRAGTRPELGTVAAQHRIEARDLLI
jgi:hypothetical protein